MNLLALNALESPEAAPESEVALLLFRFGAALWAIPALAVREIHSLPGLSPLPETAPWVVGMFVLRGEIVPVVELGARFGESSPPPALEDAVIVLDFAGAPVAILAQQVCAVGRFAASQIGALPAHGRQSGLEAPFVSGVTRWEDEIVLVLDLPRLFDSSIDFSPGAAPRFDTPRSPAPRFDMSSWTESERETLSQRAASLRVAAGSGAGQGFELQDFDLDGPGGEKRVPVAIFSLGDEEFAVPLELVREFASVASVSPVPCCPPHILGQINLRGEIVTLLDVRAVLRTPRLDPPFFEAPPRGGEAKSVSVVVVEYRSVGSGLGSGLGSGAGSGLGSGAGSGLAVGLAVDAVRDVLYLRSDEWSALSSGEGERLDSEARGSGGRDGAAHRSFFAGGAIVEGRLLPLLDIARLLGQGGLEVDETV